MAGFVSLFTVFTPIYCDAGKYMFFPKMSESGQRHYEKYMKKKKSYTSNIDSQDSVEKDEIPKIEPINTIQPHINSKRKSQYVIENEGNLDHGTIYYIKQVHCGEAVMLWLKQKTGSRFEDAKKVINNGVGKSQKKILEELIALNINDLFVEGFPQLTRTELFNCLTISKELTKLREKYKNGFPTNLSNDDLENLATYEAAPMYGIYNEHIRFHNLCQQNKKQQINDAIKRYALSYADKNIVFEKREEYLVDELATFFRSSKEKNAVVIFGSSHDFTDHFSEKFNPRVISIELVKDGNDAFKRINNLDY